MGVGNVFEDAEAGGARDVAQNSEIIILGVSWLEKGGGEA